MPCEAGAAIVAPAFACRHTRPFSGRRRLGEDVDEDRHAGFRRGVGIPHIFLDEGVLGDDVALVEMVGDLVVGLLHRVIAAVMDEAQRLAGRRGAGRGGRIGGSGLGRLLHRQDRLEIHRVVGRRQEAHHGRPGHLRALARRDGLELGDRTAEGAVEVVPGRLALADQGGAALQHHLVGEAGRGDGLVGRQDRGGGGGRRGLRAAQARGQPPEAWVQAAAPRRSAGAGAGAAGVGVAAAGGGVAGAGAGWAIAAARPSASHAATPAVARPPIDP